MELTKKIADTLDLIQSAIRTHSPATMATAFGLEGMVILDMIDRAGLEIEIFTLDTGRLPEETYSFMDVVRARYKRPVRVLFPQPAQVEEFVEAHGINGFYRSVDLRKRCCEVRKIEPLRRALAGKKLWITGLRKEQSVTRTDIEALAYDEMNGLMKLNPVADWAEADLWAYAKQFDVPTHPLHKQGYPSIGCAPCTRAIQPGEDARAGRWWWEEPESKECGLHFDPTGKLVRAKVVKGEGEMV
ncbi:MAG: phosphoadenylyl-sulfate reductase [Burkholderiales bacterium]